MFGFECEVPVMVPVYQWQKNPGDVPILAVSYRLFVQKYPGLNYQVCTPDFENLKQTRQLPGY
jgi:hypothetical protein